VFITLIYTYTIPNNHYCSKPTSLRCQLMAKCYLRVGKKSKSEARNLPTCGCKSMLEGLTIMLGVLLTLLYIFTLPNIYYSTTCICYTPIGQPSVSVFLPFFFIFSFMFFLLKHSMQVRFLIRNGLMVSSRPQQNGH